jgi:methylenetetrahydrofolate reductase (NADPH)
MRPTDLIITQMFFDAKVFIKFVEDCRRIGIACPIVPGLMCINNYPGFVKMTKFCKTRVPDELQAQMEAVKDDAIAMKQFGIDFGVRLCKELIASGHVQVLHFYTLNLEKVVYGVLDGLGMTLNASAAADEKDAASMIAKGSAWARVGDKVKTQYGEGVVAVMDQVTGNAEITIDSWFLAGKQHPVAFLQKGQFEKIF